MTKKCILLGIAVFLTSLCAVPEAFCQSLKEASKMFEKAQKLEKQVQTKEDIDKIVHLYEVALKIFQKHGIDQSVLAACWNAAWQYVKLGNYSRALELDNQGLIACRKLGAVSDEADFLYHMGIIYQYQSQYDKAMDFLQKAVQVFRKLGKEKIEADALQVMGVIRKEQSRYNEALELHEKALGLYTKIGHVSGQALALQGMAIVDDARGQYADSLVKFHKALALSKKLGDSDLESMILSNIAVVYEKIGRYSDALEILNRNLVLYKKKGDLRGELLTLMHVAQVYRYQGQPLRALELCQNGLEIAKALGDKSGEAGILSDMANNYSHLGQYSKALDFYEKALDIRTKIGDVRGEAGALHNMAITYSSWGNRSKALELYEKSLGIATKLGAWSHRAATLHGMAGMYYGMGEYAKALELAGKSLEIQKKIGSVLGEAATLNLIADLYLSWGQYAKAHELYSQSLAIRRKLGDISGEAQALADMAALYSDLGQNTKSIEALEKALEINTKTGNVEGQGSNLGTLGVVYSDIGDYQKALELFEKAKELWTKIGKPMKGPKGAFGDLYLDMGDIVRAEQFVKEGGNNGSLGRLYLMKSDYVKAREAYEKYLADAQQTGAVSQLFTAYTGLGMAYEGLGDDNKAEENFLKAVNLTEDLRSSLPRPQRERFFDVRMSGFLRTAPYEGLARVRIKMNRPAEAFKDSEYTKSRIFAEAMSRWSEGRGFDMPVEVLTRDRDLNDQLAALKKKRQEGYEKANQEIISVIEPQVQEVEAKLQAHIKILREKYPLFAATKYPQPMDLSQTALADNEWVLSYHVTDTGLIIYLTRGKNLVRALFKPTLRKEIDELVRKFRDPMELGPEDRRACLKQRLNPSVCLMRKISTFDFASGKKLADLLLGEILSDLPKDTPVIVVPDGSLGVVPFEMLVLNDGGKIVIDQGIPQTSGAEFFGDRNPISYSQSITALTLARTLGKQGRPGDRVLVVADPVFKIDDKRAQAAGNTRVADAEKRNHIETMIAMEEAGHGLRFGRLKLAGTLASDLEAIFTKGKTDCYTGLAATKKALLTTIAPSMTRYHSVVFATHGYFDKNNPRIREPILAFTCVPPGTDGLLRMSEVMGLKMNADIVALTACQTGLGRVISGEGTMGMGRAFQYAGAKSVLMSLWSVAEKSSLRLVERFFQHMNDGKSKLEALRLARKEIREQGYDHPFFWAPFILVGEVSCGQ